MPRYSSVPVYHVMKSIKAKKYSEFSHQHDLYRIIYNVVKIVSAPRGIKIKSFSKIPF